MVPRRFLDIMAATKGMNQLKVIGNNFWTIHEKDPVDITSSQTVVLLSHFTQKGMQITVLVTRIMTLFAP